MDESGNTTYRWLRECQTLDVRFPPKAEGNSSSHIGRLERGVSEPAFPSGHGLPVPRRGFTARNSGCTRTPPRLGGDHRQPQSAQPAGCAAVYLKQYLFSCSDVSFQFFPYNIQSSEVAEVRAALQSSNQQIQNFPSSQESSIPPKKVNSARKAFPQHIYLSALTPRRSVLRAAVCLPNRHILASFARWKHCLDIKYAEKRTSDLRLPANNDLLCK